MKQGNKYYLEMPRGLIFGYDLSAGALRLYYLLKEKEQRFWEEGKDTFFCKDTELIEDLQVGRRQFYQYKKELKDKNLIQITYNDYGFCVYFLPYLYK